MEVTLTGRSGVHAVAPVGKASKSESDYATTQSQLTVADHAVAPVSTLGNVRLVCVQVRSTGSVIYYSILSFKIIFCIISKPRLSNFASSIFARR